MGKANNWIEGIAEITESVREEFGDLSMDTLLIKPNPSVWSVSENLNHLIKVNSSYFPIFEALEAGTFNGAFISKIGFFPRLFGNMIYQSVSDGGKKKIKTFKQWEPSLSNTSGDILVEFFTHQDELVSWTHKMEPYVEKNTIIHSPVNKLIVYSLERAFDIIVAHEKRHFEQAKRVLKVIGGNK